MRSVYKNASGLTLVELVIVMAGASIIIMGAYSLQTYSDKSSKTSQYQSDFANMTALILKVLTTQPKAPPPPAPPPPLTLPACKAVFQNLAFNPAGQLLPGLTQAVSATSNVPLLTVAAAPLPNQLTVTKLYLEQAPGTTFDSLVVQPPAQPAATWWHYIAHLRLEATKPAITGVAAAGQAIFNSGSVMARDFFFDLYTDTNNIVQDCVATGVAAILTTTCDASTPPPDSQAGTDGAGIPVFQCNAICPPGYSVISGGCSANQITWHVVASTPLANGWTCRVAQDAGSVTAGSATGFAACQR